MDCNKTINFLHELKRLCASRDGCVADAANKERCPMFGICGDLPTRICDEDAEAAIEIVQKWSDEHPKKTYAQDFFEKFPKAKGGIDGTPFLCRQRIYGGVPLKGAEWECEECDYTGTCKDCWNEQMEE